MIPPVRGSQSPYKDCRATDDDDDDILYDAEQNTLLELCAPVLCISVLSTYSHNKRDLSIVERTEPAVSSVN
jgi:hypothetical protein